jgi:hypothetical protein
VSTLADRRKPSHPSYRRIAGPAAVVCAGLPIGPRVSRPRSVAIRRPNPRNEFHDVPSSEQVLDKCTSISCSVRLTPSLQLD